jgi:hypothetical protein
MASPITFPEQNDHLLGGQPDVKDLPVYRDGVQVVSCWTLTPAEIAEILATGQLWMIVKGQVQPPIGLSGHYPFEKHVN